MQLSLRLMFKQFGIACQNNAALRNLLGLVFCLSAANASLLIPLVFYLDGNATTFAAKEIVMTAYALTILTFIPFWTLITRRLGNRRVWYIAMLFAVFAGLSLGAQGPVLVNGIPLQIILFAVAGGAFAILLWAIIPDVVEFGQFNYGERDEAAVFGLTLFVQKASSGFMGLCVGYVLSWIGY